MSYPISWREMVRAAVNWAEEKFHATEVFRKSGFQPTATGDFPPTPILSLTQDPNAACQDTELSSLVAAFDGPGDDTDEAALISYLEAELGDTFENLMQPEWDDVLADGVERSKTFSVNGCLVSLTIDRQTASAGGCHNLGYTWGGLSGETADITCQFPDEGEDYGDLRPGDTFTFGQTLGLENFVYAADYTVTSYPHVRAHFGTPRMEPIPVDDPLRVLDDSLERMWSTPGSYMIKIPLWLEYVSPLVVLWHHAIDDPEHPGVPDEADYYVASLPPPMLWLGFAAKSRTSGLTDPLDVGTLTLNNSYYFTDGEISPARGIITSTSDAPWISQDLYKDPSDGAMPYDPLRGDDEPSFLDGGLAGLRGHGTTEANALSDLGSQVAEYEAQREFYAPELSGGGSFEVHYDTHDTSIYVNRAVCFTAGQYRAVWWMAQNWLTAQPGNDMTLNVYDMDGIPTPTEVFGTFSGGIDPINEFYAAEGVSVAVPADAYARTIRGLYDGKSWAQSGASDWQQKVVLSSDINSVILTDAEMLGGA